LKMSRRARFMDAAYMGGPPGAPQARRELELLR
jgi:hypothetical protein